MGWRMLIAIWRCWSSRHVWAIWMPPSRWPPSSTTVLVPPFRNARYLVTCVWYVFLSLCYTRCSMIRVWQCILWPVCDTMYPVTCVRYNVSCDLCIIQGILWPVWYKVFCDWPLCDARCSVMAVCDTVCSVCDTVCSLTCVWYSVLWPVCDTMCSVTFVWYSVFCDLCVIQVFCEPCDTMCPVCYTMFSVNCVWCNVFCDLYVIPCVLWPVCDTRYSVTSVWHMVFCDFSVTQSTYLCPLFDTRYSMTSVWHKDKSNNLPLCYTMCSVTCVWHKAVYNLCDTRQFITCV